MRRHQNAGFSDDGKGRSEYMLFTGVDQQTFTHDFDSDILDNSHTWTTISWCGFDAINSLLLVRMPKSKEHEEAAKRFDYQFHEALKPTGLVNAIRMWGSATIHSNNGSKEADLAWRPNRLPPQRSDNWPSVVLEVSFSEKSSKINSDIRFWLGQSEGDVKLVVILDIDRDTPDIKFETWDYDGRQPRRVQSVRVRKVRKEVSVDGDPLIISFDRLFLRAPTIPREQDIRFDALGLEEIARNIWVDQGFEPMI